MQGSQESTQIKLVVVGDGSVGKTCILLSYTTDKFPTEYVPTVFDNYTTQLTVDNQMVNLSLWDTAGQETYNRLRTLSYGSADIFLIVFSVADSSSFDNVLSKWYPELNHDELQKVPKIIVGNKIDMREENNSKHIKKASAEQVLQNQNLQYYECSALTQEGLKVVFDEAVKEALKAKNANKSVNKTGNQKQEISNGTQKKEEPCCSIY
ncbi:unnamed protein product (macronuclear) [Paramecium tetraurelia]|uniref:Chromosome undetermined scaffold_39, whole genome shotgun sequence n=1 Tax=Paramecium tetraurelia TaxID=5888 RepID=Q3SDN4_PARTE|nr:uncharacterized protein GSPATT00013836001 [Paramecium tetraurelia]CAI39324.1 rac_C03 [Paramecium tetraurelia]CAK78406.1 unnamed protein product [Paramecium tetraurelia]|eukprot:XP_001445803.1 hypothetical protein (macronuclear) [Paramecium tetraurelia strain d4-2]